MAQQFDVLCFHICVLIDVAFCETACYIPVFAFGVGFSNSSMLL